jgi:ubiquitin C-terminal hydrolase
MIDKIKDQTVVSNYMNISNNINNSMHRTGLQNVGQTCYMNATIQCLSNISELSQNLLNIFNNKQFDIDTQPLTVAFSSLLYELINSKEKYIVPSLFKEIIGKLNPLFEGLHAADSKDLIFFIIEKLHKELNRAQQIQQQNC